MPNYCVLEKKTEHNETKKIIINPQEDYTKSYVSLMLLNIECTMVDKDTKVYNNEVLWDHV